MKKLCTVLFFVLLFAGCGESQDSAGSPTQTPGGVRSTSETANQPRGVAPSDGETIRESSITTEATSQDTVARSAPTAYGYTYGQASGNRVVDGIGDLPNSQPVDVQLDGVPTWVVGAPLEDDTAWVVTLADGRVQAFRLNAAGEAEPVSISPDLLAPGQPPLVEVRNSSLELVTSDNPLASDATHPIPLSLENDEGLLGVEQDGTAFLESGENTEDLGAVALPDSRFVRGANGSLAILSSPTERYDHAVLGDGLEADNMTLIRAGEESNLEAGLIFPASGGVFESVAPLWFEMPGIEGELLAVMESEPTLATRISVYDLGGNLLAAGPYIGEPYKWRHLLAAGPFGPNGEIELVDTLTPHIGGTIEFYRPDFNTGSLNVVATMPGYTSHRIYTRNLDTVRAGDLDNDGRWELLVPNDAYTELGAIRHEINGAAVAWTLPAGGTIVTNLASATNSEGRSQVAAGREDGFLRIWP